jgi:choline dehydrogenase
LLLEAGGDYTNDPVTLDPVWFNNAGALLADPKYSIVYPLAYPNLVLRSYSEGHELGGGGAHNFLLAVRGTPSIYDGWAALTGNANWSYFGNVLNLMKNLESYTPDGTVANPAERGFSGPISITQNPPLTPVSGDYLDCLNSVTLTPFVSDYNDPSLGDIGISAVQQFITPGVGSRRSFSAYEFINPVIDANGKGIGGRKLTVITNAQVLDMRINGSMSATSVHYTKRNSERPEVEYEIVKASLTKHTGKLILAAGSVQTPNLLLQSGVGPAADIAAIGLPVVLDSPQVGQNLQCQYGGSAILAGSNVPFEAEAFIDGFPYMSNDGIRRIQIINIPVAPGVLQALPALTNPASIGSVTRTTSNPFLQPKVDIGLFNDGSVSTPGTDAYLQVSFYKIMQQVATCMGGVVLYPTSADFATDNTLLAAASNNLVIQSHIVGTARMGTDISSAVVDGNLKVFGLNNVWIGDNSVAPQTINGNTCESAYIIALVLCQVLGVPTPPAL